MSESILTDAPVEVNTLIGRCFTNDQLKALFYHACRVDIADNNDKAEIIRAILPEDEFDELGTGTNRIGLLHNGFVFKIALDRRGFVDNFTEYKRSLEVDEYLARTYESNILINVTEYITVLSQDQFRQQQEAVKATLEDLSRGYLFDDIGYTLKNSMNWGFRGDERDGSLCILDYGYLWPLNGQDTESLFMCPKCGHQLDWNPNYTGFMCSHKQCHYTARPGEIRNRMSLDIEDFENKFLSSLNDVDAPDFSNIETLITKLD